MRRTASARSTGEIPNDPINPAQRAEEIVVREQGVNSFAHAEEVDRMEQPPKRPRSKEGPKKGNIITDTIRGAWDAIADDDTDRKRR